MCRLSHSVAILSNVCETNGNLIAFHVTLVSWLFPRTPVNGSRLHTDVTGLQTFIANEFPSDLQTQHVRFTDKYFTVKEKEVLFIHKFT